MSDESATKEPGLVETEKAASHAASEPSGASAAEPQAPVLRVVRGKPSAEQLAALVAVLGSMGGGDALAPRRPSAWSTPRRRLRVSLPHGPGGWRASGLPQ